MVGRRKPTIPSGRFAIFCGAGVSVSTPSNAPLWLPFRDEIIEASIDRIARHGSHWDQPFPQKIAAFGKHPVLSRIAPEVLFQVVEASLGTPAFAALLDSIGLGSPNANHFAIAALAAQGHVSSIITTNFDCHIEQCLSDAGVPFQTLVDESEAESWARGASETAEHLVVLKVHGSLDNTESLVATVKAAGRTLSQCKARAFRRLISASDLLLIGYSGHDYDVFPELLDAVESQIPKRVFVSARNSVVWPLEELAGLNKNVVEIPNASAEYLLGQLSTDRGIALDSRVSAGEETQDWRRHVRNTIDQVSVEYLVAFFGQLALLVGDVETARSPFFVIARDLASDALSERRSPSNIRFAAEIHGALARCYISFGVAHLAEREIEQARQLYVELGEEYTTLDERELWWCTTNGAAWLLVNTEEAEEAEGIFRNSIEQAEAHRDSKFQTIGDETLVDAYIGLGSTLLLQGRQSEANEAFHQALRVSEEFGSLWLAARADLALAEAARESDSEKSATHTSAAQRRLSFMGLKVEDVGFLGANPSAQSS